MQKLLDIASVFHSLSGWGRVGLDGGLVFRGPFCAHSFYCCVCVSSVKCPRADWSPSLCTGLRRSWRTKTSGSGPRPSTSLQASSKEPRMRCAARTQGPGWRGPFSQQTPSSAGLPSRIYFRRIKWFFWALSLDFCCCFFRSLVEVKVCTDVQPSLKGSAPGRRLGLLASALPETPEHRDELRVECFPVEDC